MPRTLTVNRARAAPATAPTASREAEELPLPLTPACDPWDVCPVPSGCGDTGGTWGQERVVWHTHTQMSGHQGRYVGMAACDGAHAYPTILSTGGGGRQAIHRVKTTRGACGACCCCGEESHPNPQMRCCQWCHHHEKPQRPSPVTDPQPDMQQPRVHAGGAGDNHRCWAGHRHGRLEREAPLCVGVLRGLVGTQRLVIKQRGLTHDFHVPHSGAAVATRSR